MQVSVQNKTKQNTAATGKELQGGGLAWNIDLGRRWVVDLERLT